MDKMLPGEPDLPTPGDLLNDMAELQREIRMVQLTGKTIQVAQLYKWQERKINIALVGVEVILRMLLEAEENVH